MFRVLQVSTLVVCGLLLGLMFLPTGSSANEVVEGYQSTLSYAASGTMRYQLLSAIHAGDPLLDDVKKSAGERVDYLWVDEAGNPVFPKKTSTFPQRGGSLADWRDHEGGSNGYHRGTDYVPNGVDKHAAPLYQVALWGGEVVYVNNSSKGWGNQVVVDHGNGFYTRYAHMAYGGSTAPRWQKGKTGSSIMVKVGDKLQPGQRIGLLGSTGNSTGAHAHVELMLFPMGFDPSVRSYYCGGLDNVLLGAKELNEITWYNMASRERPGDQKTWEELTGDNDE